MKMATLCYIRKNDQTLMLHRVKKENDIHQDKWNGLGGKFLQGETPEACAKREIEEESGLIATKMEMKGFITFPNFAHSEDWYVFVFTVSEFEGEMKESPEGNLEWIDNNKIHDLPLWEGDHIFLKWLEKDIFFSGKFVYQDGKLTKHDVTFYNNTHLL